MNVNKVVVAVSMSILVGLILLGVGVTWLMTWATTPKHPETVPGPTITVTATPAPAPTETVEVEVPVTPKACSDFVDDADTLVSLEAEVIDLASQALTAVSEFDTEEIERINKEMDKITPKVEKARDAYNDSRVACASA